MSVRTGMAVLGDYTVVAGQSRLQNLYNLIPDPDTSSSSGSVAGGTNGVANSYLDEMSPAAAAQLQVEILDLQARGASGAYVVVAADDVANQINIVTGLASITVANCAVSIWRAGSNVINAAVISTPVAGTLRIADGGTYAATAGDSVVWHARP